MMALFSMRSSIPKTRPQAEMRISQKADGACKWLGPF